jgi:hypothetical protein
MSKFNDLTDKKFGKLTAIKYLRNRKWLCLCECGNTTEIFTQNLTRDHTKSCGCFRVQTMSTHGKYKTRIYGIYNAMISRCHRPNATEYERYGGRGICVCEEWKNDFMSFYSWSMLNGYTDKLTIDRKNNDIGYNPNNCRWTSNFTQQQNKTKSIRNTSGFKGVHWHSQTKKWRARITVNYKSISLGTYSDIKDAINSRIEGENKYQNKF